MVRSCFMLICVLLYTNAYGASTGAESCGPNEEYVDCPLALCRNFNCKTKGYIPPCPAIVEPCPAECICKYGYLRDENGACIPEDECKPNPCGYNEVWTNCTQTVCRQQQCSEKDHPVDCPEVAEEHCEAGCVCEENHFRTGPWCRSLEQCDDFLKSSGSGSLDEIIKDTFA